MLDSEIDSESEPQYGQQLRGRKISQIAFPIFPTFSDFSPLFPTFFYENVGEMGKFPKFQKYFSYSQCLQTHALELYRCRARAEGSVEAIWRLY
jgi:hypothetical protein